MVKKWLLEPHTWLFKARLNLRTGVGGGGCHPREALGCGSLAMVPGADGKETISFCNDREARGEVRLGVGATTDLFWKEAFAGKK